MLRPLLRVYFDFVDPLSYVASLALSARDDDGPEAAIEWTGFELRPPPHPLTGVDDPLWVGRRAAALERAESLGLSVVLRPPALVPWTRKAHELHILAASHGKGDAVRSAIFDAFFVDGRDIGRVDVLVAIASALGLDRTETKAVLDVDRHEADVDRTRREALDAGLGEVPCHSVGGPLREGFPDPDDLGTLLPDD